MRIALDATPLREARTGVPQTVFELLDALPADVEVIPYVPSGRALLARARRQPDDLPPGTRLLPVPARVFMRAWARSDWPPADRWLGDADVVHGTNFVVPPMRRRPTTVTVHDCWCARHPECCLPERAAFTKLVQRAVDRGAWLHVSTKYMAREVAELYGATERVAVVPFGVPPVGSPGGGDVSLPAAVGDGPFVLALGSVDPRKAYDALVRSFGRATAGGDLGDLRLVVAGPDGPGRPALDAALATLPGDVAARVVVLGWVDDAVRRALLSRATVLAYPSLYEGFGFPVLEAMAAGVPVVATAAGGVPEVAGDAAALVAVGDDDALAGALTRVVTDDALRARLVAAGHARAATFTWERTATGMVELWRRLADAG
ncbi:MAG: glycosyltransferase family 4 protein [Acidimicrobiia bacterium]|nr:glycosyltransferase family 4 protein [Acidimicrobiia bacterium]